MATRILLARHGETDWSKEDRFCGISDIPLNQAGREQARALSRRLAHMKLFLKDDTIADLEVLVGNARKQEQITAIYSSTKTRSLETASIVAEMLQLKVNMVPELRELDYGAWEGLRRDEILSQHPREFETWSKDPALYAPPRGETGLSLVARVRPGINRLIAKHRDETVLIVSHKTVNRLLICSLFNIPLKHYRWIIWQNTACLNILNFVSEDAVSLIKLNDTSHIEAISNYRTKDT